MKNIAQRLNTLALTVKRLIERFTDKRFKGVHPNLAALKTAYSAASAGDYATIDAGTGQSAKLAIWDENDSDWVEIGEVSLATTDMVVEGEDNLYFKDYRVKAAFISENVTFSAAALANNATTSNTVNIASRYQLLHI